MSELAPELRRAKARAQELRRANIDGHIWLEIRMLPPHPMAGQTYYTCEVP